MREKLSRGEAIRLIARARELLCEEGSLREFMDDYRAGTVREALLDAYDGVSNGFLSQVCQAVLGRKVEVVGEPRLRLPCPCCGRRTLTESFDPDEGTGYDICDHCGWEDDGTADDQADSGVNRGTMAQYRARVREDSNYYCSDKWPS